MRNNVYSDIFWYKDMFLPVSEKNEHVHNFIYNKHDELGGDDITNSLIWIFTWTGQEMFSEKICEISNVITSLFLIRFSSFLHRSLGENNFSFGIMLIMDWLAL